MRSADRGRTKKTEPTGALGWFRRRTSNKYIFNTINSIRYYYIILYNQLPHLPAVSVYANCCLVCAVDAARFEKDDRPKIAFMGTREHTVYASRYNNNYRKSLVMLFFPERNNPHVRRRENTFVFFYSLLYGCYCAGVKYWNKIHDMAKNNVRYVIDFCEHVLSRVHRQQYRVTVWNYRGIYATGCSVMNK